MAARAGGDRGHGGGWRGGGGVGWLPAPPPMPAADASAAPTSGGAPTPTEPESTVTRGAPTREQVRQAAMQRAAGFVDEIRSSLEFYTAQAQGSRIDHVLVCGGGSKLDGLVELLGQRIPA